MFSFGTKFLFNVVHHTLVSYNMRSIVRFCLSFAGARCPSIPQFLCSSPFIQIVCTLLTSRYEFLYRYMAFNIGWFCRDSDKSKHRINLFRFAVISFPHVHKLPLIWKRWFCPTSTKHDHLTPYFCVRH